MIKRRGERIDFDGTESTAPGVGGYVLGRARQATDGEDGAWVATATFIPIEDEESLYEVHGYGASAEEAERASVAGLHEHRGNRVQTMVVDSEQARRFIEASGHVHELQQALKALDLADATEDVDAQRFLRAHAVTLYGRTFGSNVRRGLSSFITISEADSVTHGSLRMLRNKNVAHSENFMTVTTPAVDLVRAPTGDIEVDVVWSLTRESGMPAPFADKFRELLIRSLTLLREALAPFRDEVRNALTIADRAELFQRPQPLQFVPVPVSEWQPAHVRSRFPSHLAPVHIDPGMEVSTVLTIDR